MHQQAPQTLFAPVESAEKKELTSNRPCPAVLARLESHSTVVPVGGASRLYRAAPARPQPSSSRKGCSNPTGNKKLLLNFEDPLMQLSQEDDIFLNCPDHPPSQALENASTLAIIKIC